MNKLNKIICFLLLSFTTTSYAVEGFTANAGVTSNYLWRGLEQTNGQPAVFGGIDYEHQSGFYVGTWVSNADWADGMTYEIDVYGGYAGEIKNIGYDIGFVYYAYPDTVEDLDFTEGNANIAYSFLTLNYAVLASADGVDFGDDSYVSMNADFPIFSEMELSFHIGKGMDEFYAGESFVDYGASVNKNGFSFGISKTNLDNDDLKVMVSYTVDI